MQQNKLLRTPHLVYWWSQSCGSSSTYLPYFALCPLHFSATIALFVNLHSGEPVTKIREADQLRKDKKSGSVVYLLQNRFLKVKDRRKGHHNMRGSQALTESVPYNLNNHKKSFSKGPCNIINISNSNIINYTDTDIKHSIETINPTKYLGCGKKLKESDNTVHSSGENNFQENCTDSYKRSTELSVIVAIKDTKHYLENFSLYRSVNLSEETVQNQENSSLSRRVNAPEEDVQDLPPHHLDQPKILTGEEVIIGYSENIALSRKVSLSEEDVQDHPLQHPDQPRILTCEEHSLLQDLLESTKRTKELTEIESYTRQNALPPFALLHRLCAWASKSDQVGLINRVQELTQKIYPDEYRKHLGFRYYLASALCYGGDVKGGLEELSQLYSNHPKKQKKIKDTATFIIYQIIKSDNEEHENLAFDFVNNVAANLGQLGPALSLWSVSFSSSLYRLQVMSDELLERHPGLLKMLDRKLESMVKRASWNGDDELLNRILQVALRYELSKHFSFITNALLQLQCDIGDINGADETIKFAKNVGVRLTPSALQRFMALLNHHRCPAPLSLLALKYGPPPPETPRPKPPKFKYRF